MSKLKAIFLGVLIGIGILAPAILLKHPPTSAENPDAERYRRGQVTYGDDQLQTFNEAVGAGLSVEREILIEQNHFVFSPTGGSASIKWSAQSGGPFTDQIDVNDGESISLPFERSARTFFTVTFPGAGGSYRLFMTGRSDNIPGKKGGSK